MLYDIYNRYEPYPEEEQEQRARMLQRLERGRQVIREILPHLRREIENTQRDPENVYQVLKPYHMEGEGVQMTPQDLPEIYSLCRLILEKGGLEQNQIQRFLLRLVGNTAVPQSVPFLLDMLHYSRQGDQFGPERRQLALWGLARIARLHAVPEAYAALHKGLEDRHAGVRFTAVDLILDAYLAAQRPVPTRIVEKLRKMATSDPDKDVRYRACRNLEASWAKDLDKGV